VSARVCPAEICADRPDATHILTCARLACANVNTDTELPQSSASKRKRAMWFLHRSHAGIVSYTRLRALGPAKWSQKGYPSDVFDFFSAFSVRVDTALRCERRAATLATIVVSILVEGSFIASSLDDFAARFCLDYAYLPGSLSVIRSLSHLAIVCRTVKSATCGSWPHVLHRRGLPCL